MNCLTVLRAKSTLRYTLALIALLAFAFSNASRADSITNIGGTIQGSNAGLTLTSSVNGVGSISGLGTLGSMTITTGSLLTGSLGAGGTFDGGSFVISANANGIANGLPAGHGAVFNGTFSGPVTWTVNVAANGTYTYTLTGAVTGTFLGGSSPFGGTTQITIVLKAPFSGAKVGLAGGLTTLATAPEPGTFGLLGSGLIGMAAMIRRRASGYWFSRKVARQS
jgi:hypothetical protein